MFLSPIGLGASGLGYTKKILGFDNKTYRNKILLDSEDPLGDGSADAVYRLNGSINKIGAPFNVGDSTIQFSKGRYGKGLSGGEVSISSYFVEYGNIPQIFFTWTGNGGDQLAIKYFNNKCISIYPSYGSENKFAIKYSTSDDGSNKEVKYSNFVTEDNISYVFGLVTASNGILLYVNNVPVFMFSWLGIDEAKKILDGDGNQISYASISPENGVIENFKIINKELSTQEIGVISNGIDYVNNPIIDLAPINYIKFNGNTLDTITSNKLILSGSDSYANNAPDIAKHFNGNDTFLQMPGSDSMQLTTDFSVSVNFMVSSGTGEIAILSKSTNADDSQFNLFIRGDTTGQYEKVVCITSARDGEVDEGVVYYNIEYDIPYNIVISVNEGYEKSIYINGKYIDLLSPPFYVKNSSNSIYIGNDNDYSGGSYFDGVIWDVILFDRELSEKEVSIIYDYSFGHEDIPVRIGLKYFYPLKKNTESSWKENTVLAYDQSSIHFDNNNGMNFSSSTSKYLEFSNGIFFGSSYNDVKYISMQIVPDTGINHDQILFSNGDAKIGDKYNGVTVGIDSNYKLFCILQDDDNNVLIEKNNIIDIAPGELSTITFTPKFGTFDKCIIYINGTEALSFNPGSSYTVVNSKTVIGAGIDKDESTHFNGYIKNLRFYTRKLNDKEIIRLSNE